MLVADQALAVLDEETKDSIAQALWLPAFDASVLPAEVRDRLSHQRNSNAAFGERMCYRLRHLLDNPDSFTASYARRYEMLIQHATSLSPHQAYAMSALLGKDGSKGYRRLPERADLQFPRDNAEDLEAQTGWYFFVGSCTDSNGKEYGVELMIWRYALLPLPAAREFGLSDIENQVVELQFAISEAGGRHYQAVPIVIAGTTGLLNFGRDAIDARVGRNRVQQLTNGLFPIQVQAQGVYRGEGGPVDLGIDLTFTDGKPYLRQGADGCMPCCGGVGTLYYSIPRLVLDPAVSRLTLDGEQVSLTKGTFWFDHQWGTGMVPPGSPRSHVLRAAATMQEPGNGGWDWFMAQFEGDRQLTVSALHSAAYQAFYAQTGPTPPGTMSVPVKGKYMDAAGAVVDITGTMEIPRWIKVEDTPDPAQYPPPNTWYPDRWHFRFDAPVPEDLRSVSMTPIVRNGQSGFFAFGGHYSEGAVYLYDDAGRDIGRGFAESVAYAEMLPTILRLAGLPDSEEMVAAVTPKRPPLLTRAAAIAYLAWPPHGRELKQTLECCEENGLS